MIKKKCCFSIRCICLNRGLTNPTLDQFKTFAQYCFLKSGLFVGSVSRNREGICFLFFFLHIVMEASRRIKPYKVIEFLLWYCQFVVTKWFLTLLLKEYVYYYNKGILYLIFGEFWKDFTNVYNQKVMDFF